MANGDEIELISDGEGLAIIGKPGAVERFMACSGLARHEGPSRTASVFSVGAGIAQVGAEVAANAGRWVKLTEESAQAVKAFGLTPTKTPGVNHAMVGDPGNIQQWIQIVGSPGAILTNPAMLAGAAGIMSQLAMKQQMDAITDYLEVIDQKLDDLIRSQTNQILARMDGVELAIREATTVQEAVGRVSEVTWSKVQHQSSTIFETQAFALRQLGDLADKVERQRKVDDMADTARATEAELGKWVAVLARCFQLLDAIAVLEIARVLDSAPDEIDRHRLGLRAARDERRQLMADRTQELVDRMDAAVGLANAKVLFNPRDSPAVVASRNRVVDEVEGFHGVLGIESGIDTVEAKRWREAAGDRVDSARDAGAHGVDLAKRFGSSTRDGARSVKDKASHGVADRWSRWRQDDEPPAGS